MDADPGWQCFCAVVGVRHVINAPARLRKLQQLIVFTKTQFGGRSRCRDALYPVIQFGNRQLITQLLIQQSFGRFGDDRVLPLLFDAYLAGSAIYLRGADIECAPQIDLIVLCVLLPANKRRENYWQESGAVCKHQVRVLVRRCIASSTCSLSGLVSSASSQISRASASRPMTHNTSPRWAATSGSGNAA